MLDDLGMWLLGIFGPWGTLGVLIFVFLIFFIDALFFPTLPELFFVIGFMANPTLLFGCELIAVGVTGQILGMSLLYFIVEHVRVPDKLKRVADKYVNFLILRDERMLLVNHVAPMIPFAGAFISIVDIWRIDRALMYVALGCVMKYTVIMAMSSFFYAYFSSGTAQLYTIAFVLSLVAISLTAAFIRKKRHERAEHS
jgi:hypothetical protein